MAGVIGKKRENGGNRLEKDKVRLKGRDCGKVLAEYKSLINRRFGRNKYHNRIISGLRIGADVVRKGSVSGRDCCAGYIWTVYNDRFFHKLNQHILR